LPDVPAEIKQLGRCLDPRGRGNGPVALGRGRQPFGVHGRRVDGTLGAGIIGIGVTGVSGGHATYDARPRRLPGPRAG